MGVVLATADRPQSPLNQVGVAEPPPATVNKPNIIPLNKIFSSTSRVGVAEPSPALGVTLALPTLGPYVAPTEPGVHASSVKGAVTTALPTNADEPYVTPAGKRKPDLPSQVGVTITAATPVSDAFVTAAGQAVHSSPPDVTTAAPVGESYVTPAGAGKPGLLSGTSVTPATLTGEHLVTPASLLSSPSGVGVTAAIPKRKAYDPLSGAVSSSSGADKPRAIPSFGSSKVPSSAGVTRPPSAVGKSAGVPSFRTYNSPGIVRATRPITTEGMTQIHPIERPFTTPSAVRAPRLPADHDSSLAGLNVINALPSGINQAAVGGRVRLPASSIYTASMLATLPIGGSYTAPVIHESSTLKPKSSFGPPLSPVAVTEVQPTRRSYSPPRRLNSRSPTSAPRVTSAQTAGTGYSRSSGIRRSAVPSEGTYSPPAAAARILPVQSSEVYAPPTSTHSQSRYNKVRYFYLIFFLLVCMCM